MELHNLVIILVISLSFKKISTLAEYLGPADVVLERVEECEYPEEFLHPMEITMSKVNRTHIKIDGCLNLTSPMDHTISANVSAARWGDGGWKINAFNFFDPNACDAISKHLTKPWQIILSAMQAASYECPLAPKYYCLKDFMHTPDFFYPSTLYGSFRVDAILQLNDVPYVCIRLYVVSSPANVPKLWRR